jgi:hypothetical protein
MGGRIAEDTGRVTTGVYLDELENVELVARRGRWAAENRRPFLVPMAPVTWTSFRFRP